MHLVVIGLNHKTAPVEIREKLSISNDALSDALASLKSSRLTSECLILSTCNRTEVYAVTESGAHDTAIAGWLARYFHILEEAVSPHLYSYAGHKAAEHLFRVASGVDSMVVGEAQILGQVKSAYAAARQGQFTGTVLNNLFQQAITVGKRARTETEISKGAFSVGSVAVQLAGSIFDNLSRCTALVIGAGKMSELAIAHLVSAGVTDILVANRTHEKAVALANQYCGRAALFDDLASVLESADIVITSTGSSEPIITRKMAAAAHHARRGRPVFFIDMAVPRDIEPGVGELDNVFLYNIDDLQAVVSAHSAGRQVEAARVETIIAEEIVEFLVWFRSLDAVPVITALRDKLEDIRSSEFDKLMTKLPDLSPDQREAVNAAMRSVVNKICHNPMIQIKGYAADQSSSEKLATICEVFGICPNEAEKPAEPGDSEPGQ